VRAVDDAAVTSTGGRRGRKRPHLRLALMAALVGIPLAAAAVAAVAAIRASERADAANDIAASRALAAAAMRALDDEPDLAMLLALEAFQRVHDRPPAETYEARNSLVSALTRYPHLVAVLHADEGAAAVEFSSDGRWLATAAADGTTRLWDARRRAPLGRAMPGRGTCFTGAGDIDVQFAPGDQAVVQTGCGAAVVFDSSSGHVLRRLGGSTDARGEEETDGLLSPDGRLLVVEGEWSGMRVIDVETVKTIWQRPALSDSYRSPVTVSGDSRVVATSRVVSGSGTFSTQIYLLRSGAPVGGPLVGRSILALSPRGDVAVVRNARAVSLWDLRRRRAIGRALPVEDVLRAAFDASGRRLAISSDDGFVYVWRLTRTWRRQWLIRLRHDGVLGLRFDPSGTTLATAAPQGTVRLWDVSKRWPPLLERIDRAGSEDELVFSPDGRRLLATSVDAATILTERPSEGLVKQHVESGIGWHAQFSPDGGSIVSAFNEPGTVGFWDVKTHRLSREIEIRTSPYEIDDVALSPNGRLVAVTDDDGLRFWDAKSGRRASRPLAAFAPIAFSPDGRLLVSGSVSVVGLGDWKHTLRFWGVEKRSLLHVSSDGTEPLDFAFSPDGRTLAVAEDTGHTPEEETVALWDVDRRMLVDRLVVIPPSMRPPPGDCCGNINALDFTPDGSTLAATSMIGLTLWDTAASARLGDTVQIDLWDVAVRPDGRTLAVAGERGVFLLDPLVLGGDAGEWSRRLCTIANRELTELERRRYLGSDSSQGPCHA
jgi:WD40 repeat protein